MGVGQEWVGGFEGKGYIRGAKGAGKFFPCIFLCVGQSVSGWVPLAPPPPWGGGGSSAVCACQKWVPLFGICPPSLRWVKNGLGWGSNGTGLGNSNQSNIAYGWRCASGPPALKHKFYLVYTTDPLCMLFKDRSSQVAAH